MILNEKTILIVPFLISLIYVQVSSEKGKSWKVGVGGTGLILVQTKVLYPTGPLLTIQESYCATAHINSIQAIMELSYFNTKKSISCLKFLIIRKSLSDQFRLNSIFDHFNDWGQ